MSKRKHTPTAIQQLIRRQLKPEKPGGLTRYALAVACGWQPSAIYGMLRRPTTRHQRVETMLAALNAAITINGETVQLALVDGKVQVTNDALR